MMKIYMVNGVTRQYEEGEQPEGAVEVKKPVEEKAKKPANKKRKAATK